MLRTALWIGFILRLLGAMWNGFVGPSYGVPDAGGFHLMAVSYSRNLVPGDEPLLNEHFYTYILGRIYFLTTDSLFLGSFLSVVVWLASAFILVRIMRLLSIDNSHQFKAMLIYSLLPSAVLMTSVTLREPYQLFFVNLAIYSALKIYLNKSATHWLFLFCGVIGIGLLHGALLVFGLFILIATLLLLALRGRKGFALVKLAFAVPLVALIVSYGLSLFTSISYELKDGLVIAVETYQQGLLGTDARAYYKDLVEIDGVAGFLAFIPITLFQYLFEPMPWRISTVLDISLMFENILRAWLIWKAWTGLRNMPVQGRRPVLFVFLSYLILETMWSLGTVNWGTAARHHIPSMGLLVIAAFVYTRRGSPRVGSSLKLTVG